MPSTVAASLGRLWHVISNARNEVAHPGLQDIDLEIAAERLGDIAKVLATINEPERSRAVEAIRSDIMPFTTPAYKFRQGGRDVYAFSLDLETLNNLLPDRVDERVVKDANRPLTLNHAKEIQRYLEGPNKWLLGTLLLGISPDAVEFRSYMDDQNAVSSVGELQIRAEGATSMKMFDRPSTDDGPSRTCCMTFLTIARYSEKLSSPERKHRCPVMLYVEDSIEALRQMFADAAQTRTIERNTVTRFDQRDALQPSRVVDCGNQRPVCRGVSRWSVPPSQGAAKA